MPIFCDILSILSPYAATFPALLTNAAPAAADAVPIAATATAPVFAAVPKPLFSFPPNPLAFCSAEFSPFSYSDESRVIFAIRSNTSII